MHQCKTYISFSDVDVSGHKTSIFFSHHQLNSDFDEGMRKIQRHTFHIPTRKLVNINIDYKQMGVGGDTSWGAMPHPEYRIKPPNLSYGYIIKPIK